jgi:predicted DNA-binding transcriptional regulator AlpA
MNDGDLPDWPLGLSEALAAAYLGISASLFRREWEARRMPQPIRLTRGRQVWHRQQLTAWLDAKAGVANSPQPRTDHTLVDEWDQACGTREPALSEHL